MSKEFDCSWDDITSLNYRAFIHRSAFLDHKLKEEQKNLPKR